MLNPDYAKSRDSSVKAVALPAEGAATGNKVLLDTYRLLAMTLAFSATTAIGTAALALPAPGIMATLAGYFGLLFLTSYLRNSAWGLVSVFGLTGFMGYTLGPVVNAYLATANGPALVASAMGITGVVFLGLSFYARSARAPNMLALGNFILVGILTAFGLGLAAIFFALPSLALAVSGLFVLLMCGLIMYETQNIVRGGETNYIMATVTLFVSIYNLFASLLHILGFLGAEDS